MVLRDFTMKNLLKIKHHGEGYGFGDGSGNGYGNGYGSGDGCEEDI